MGGHSKSGQEVSWSLIGRQLTVVIALTVVALVVAFTATTIRGERAAFTSAEVKFTDTSSSGLQIVPASCPSVPSNPDYPHNTCSPPLPPTGLTATCSGSGTLVTLEWNPVSGATAYPLRVDDPANGWSGLCDGSQNPNDTCQNISSTWYTRSVTPGSTYSWWVHAYNSNGWSSATSGSFTCTAGNSCQVGYTLQNGRCVFTACPSGYTQQTGSNGQPECVLVGGGSCTPSHFCQGNDLYYRTSQCSNQFVPPTCEYGCSGGACLGVPTPSIVTWNVRPTLVRSGDLVRVTWAAENVQSCTISGTNSDSWSGLSSAAATCTHSADGQSCVSTPIFAQTIYTITCQGFAGASPSTVTRSTTVNIAPTFIDL